MKRYLLFLAFLMPALLPLLAQNWDISTVDQINSVVGVPLAMALAGWIKHDRDLLKDALYVGTSVAGTFVLTYGLKYIVDRARPYESYPDRINPYSLESDPSFPSGHTATAFALATSLCIRYPKWYVIAPSALWACSVGLSRMNEGVHYPTDVLAGAVLGAGFAVANVYINRWLNRWLFGE